MHRYRHNGFIIEFWLDVPRCPSPFYFNSLIIQLIYVRDDRLLFYLSHVHVHFVRKFLSADRQIDKVEQHLRCWIIPYCALLLEDPLRPPTFNSKSWRNANTSLFDRFGTVSVQCRPITPSIHPWKVDEGKRVWNLRWFLTLSHQRKQTFVCVCVCVSLRRMQTWRKKGLDLKQLRLHTFEIVLISPKCQLFRGTFLSSVLLIISIQLEQPSPIEFECNHI